MNMKYTALLFVAFGALAVHCSQETDDSEWVNVVHAQQVDFTPAAAQQTATHIPPISITIASSEPSSPRATPQRVSPVALAATASDNRNANSFHTATSSATPIPLNNLGGNSPKTSPVELADGSPSSKNASWVSPKNSGGHVQISPTAHLSSKPVTPQSINAGVQKASAVLAAAQASTAPAHIVIPSTKITRFDSMSGDKFVGAPNKPQTTAQSSNPVAALQLPTTQAVKITVEPAANIAHPQRAPVAQPKAKSCFASLASCFKYLGCKSCFGSCCPASPIARQTKNSDHTK